MRELINKARSLALFLWDVIIPRFITEDVALSGSGPEWEDYFIVCSMADVAAGEEHDAVATVDAFQFLGMGITYRIWNFRPWPAAKERSNG